MRSCRSAKGKSTSLFDDGDVSAKEETLAYAYADDDSRSSLFDCDLGHPSAVAVNVSRTIFGTTITFMFATMMAGVMQ